MTDQTIIALIRTDQRDKALDALYRFYPPIRKMIRNNGGSRPDAEDIFQESLIILCKKVRETDFILTAQLSTYLFSVARYLWKDEFKKRKNYTAGTFEVLDDSGIEAAVERERDARLAEKVLQELGDRCQELLLLYYTGKMKLKDIAVKMGYGSENTAKNQKYKCLEGARNRLRELQQKAQISTH